MIYTVVMDTAQGMRELDFTTGEEADAYLAGVTPDTDGTITPNVTDATKAAMEARGLEHNKGAFWYGNLYAIQYTPAPVLEWEA